MVRAPGGSPSTAQSQCEAINGCSDGRAHKQALEAVEGESICLNLLFWSDEIILNSRGWDLTGWTGISVDRTGGVTRDNLRLDCQTPVQQMADK